MKRILIITALLVLLSSCTQTPAPVPTSTATLRPTATGTPTPTATATTEPTKVSPSMENLPAEWKDRIDRIETMTEMDGKTTRVVAIEKLPDEDIAAGKEPKLRALQWDADAGEWMAYAPQVGLVSAEESKFWDRVQIDDLPVSELTDRMNQETIQGKDGQEIEPGVVAVFSDWTVLCGDVVDFDYYKTNGDGHTNVNLVIAIPLSTGDIELFYISGSSPDRPSSMRYGVYRLDGVDPNAVDTEDMTLGSQVERFSPLSPQEYWTFVRDKTITDPHRRVVFGVDRSGRPYQDMTGQLVDGTVFGSSSANVLIQNTIFMSAEEYDSIR